MLHHVHFTDIFVSVSGPKNDDVMITVDTILHAVIHCQSREIRTFYHQNRCFCFLVENVFLLNFE